MKVLAFGEIVWDVVGERESIGGAPFNVAAHAARCGLEAFFYGRIGDDPRGRRAIAELDRLGVNRNWLRTDPSRPTGWVDVVLDADGQPRYAIGENAAWDAIAAPSAEEASRLNASGFDALVCGTLAQRSKTSRQALRAVRNALPGVPVVYDVNLRLPHTPLPLVWETLPGVSVVKVNDEEAALLAQSRWGAALSPAALFHALRDDFGCQLLLLTRGAAGCLVASGEGVAETPGTPIAVANAVGAGDAFLATFLAGWLGGSSPVDAAQRANQVGAWVASRPEAVPDYPTHGFGFHQQAPCREI